MTEFFCNFAVCKKAKDYYNRQNDKKNCAIYAADDGCVTLVAPVIDIV